MLQENTTSNLPETLEGLKYLAGVLFGGGAFKVWDIWQKSRDSKRDNDRLDRITELDVKKALGDQEIRSSQILKDLIEYLKQERDAKSLIIDRQQDELDLLKEDILLMKSEIISLKNTITNFESLHQDLPLPQWLKGRDSRMISLNPAYESAFNVHAENYVGKTDAEFWSERLGREGKELGEEYRKVDMEVLRKRRPIHAIEKVIDPETRKEFYWYIYKYPVFSNRAIIGIGGIAYKTVDTKPEIVPDGFEI